VEKIKTIKKINSTSIMIVKSISIVSSLEVYEDKYYLDNLKEILKWD